MDQHAQSTAGTPAPYGEACTSCARSKCKCIIVRGEGACERCLRLNKECRPAQSIRRRQSRQPAVSRTARLEEKLDSLVSMMKAGTHANVSAHRQSGGFSPPFSPPNNTNDHTEMLTPASSDCIVDDTLTPLSSNAEQDLERFRTLYLENFPFVHLPPSVTAQTLAQERPFLWLCITAITSKSTSQQQVIASRVRQRIAQEIVIQSERNIDLLLGLLVFIGWAHFQIQSNPFVTVFTQLAMSLVFDLGLNHPVPDDTQILPCAKKSYRKPTTPRTMEERRAVLGCYLLTSMISLFLQKIDTLRWTPHMYECLRILDEEKECRNDEILVHQIRLRVIGEEIDSSIAYRRKATLFEASMADRYTSSDTYEFQLHEIKAGLLSHPQTQVVLLHLHSLELDIAFPANHLRVKQSIFRGANDRC